MAALLAAAALALPHGIATITTPRTTVSVRVEIAETEPAWKRGLMYRRQLAARSGMIFVFPADFRVRFWMKNTRIPLSIAFFDSNGRILRIRDMSPCRRDPCPRYGAGAPFRGALEVNRGALRRWDVHAGDTITLRRRA
jgi:uncharacterized protein